ncbi:MAG: DUF4345 family protein [Pseudomonadota bacterium]
MGIVLRIGLGLIGVAIIFLGLNVGLGGIATLGWQGAGKFITIIDQDLFEVRDNHVRFIGGVWLGVGLVFLASAFLLTKLKPTLLVLFLVIFVGGLARLSALDMGLLLSADILPSLLMELVVFPLIGLWVFLQEPRYA